MAGNEVNARWQAEMSRYFTSLDGRQPDEGLLLLDEIFNLDEQLLALEEGRPGGGRDEGCEIEGSEDSGLESF